MLKLTNISKSYNKKEVFSNVNYEFQDKGLYLLAGEIGTGKSTLLEIIASLTSSSGNIYYNNQKTNHSILKGTRNRRKHISISNDFFPLKMNKTIEENYHLVKSSLKPQEQSTFDFYKLLEFLELNIFKNSPVSTLSTGQLLRLRICLMLMKAADIYLFDEPTSVIDAEIGTKIWNLIEQVSALSLVIVATHDESEILKPSLDSIKITPTILLAHLKTSNETSPQFLMNPRTEIVKKAYHHRFVRSPFCWSFVSICFLLGLVGALLSSLFAPSLTEIVSPSRNNYQLTNTDSKEATLRNTKLTIGDIYNSLDNNDLWWIGSETLHFDYISNTHYHSTFTSDDIKSLTPYEYKFLALPTELLDLTKPVSDGFILSTMAATKITTYLNNSYHMNYSSSDLYKILQIGKLPLKEIIDGHEMSVFIPSSLLSNQLQGKFRGYEDLYEPIYDNKGEIINSLSADEIIVSQKYYQSHHQDLTVYIEELSKTFNIIGFYHNDKKIDPEKPIDPMYISSNYNLKQYYFCPLDFDKPMGDTFRFNGVYGAVYVYNADNNYHDSKGLKYNDTYQTLDKIKYTEFLKLTYSLPIILTITFFIISLFAILVIEYLSYKEDIYRHKLNYFLGENPLLFIFSSIPFISFGTAFILASLIASIFNFDLFAMLISLVVLFVFYISSLLIRWSLYRLVTKKHGL